MFSSGFIAYAWPFGAQMFARSDEVHDACVFNVDRWTQCLLGIRSHW